MSSGRSGSLQSSSCGGAIRNTLIFLFLLYAKGVFAEPSIMNDLEIYGRALANYQLCAQLGKDKQDSTMYDYYRTMFNDSLVEINTYPKNISDLIFDEFTRSADKLDRLNKYSMWQFCSSRFDLLMRKMQDKKLNAVN